MNLICSWEACARELSLPNTKIIPQTSASLCMQVFIEEALSS